MRCVRSKADGLVKACENPWAVLVVAVGVCSDIRLVLLGGIRCESRIVGSCNQQGSDAVLHSRARGWAASLVAYYDLTASKEAEEVQDDLVALVVAGSSCRTPTSGSLVVQNGSSFWKPDPSCLEGTGHGKKLLLLGLCSFA